MLAGELLGTAPKTETAQRHAAPQGDESGSTAESEVQQHGRDFAADVEEERSLPDPNTDISPRKDDDAQLQVEPLLLKERATVAEIEVPETIAPVGKDDSTRKAGDLSETEGPAIASVDPEALGIASPTPAEGGPRVAPEPAGTVTTVTTPVGSKQAVAPNDTNLAAPQMPPKSSRVSSEPVAQEKQPVKLGAATADAEVVRESANNEPVREIPVPNTNSRRLPDPHPNQSAIPNANVSLSEGNAPATITPQAAPVDGVATAEVVSIQPRPKDAAQAQSLTAEPRARIDVRRTAETGGVPAPVEQKADVSQPAILGGKAAPTEGVATSNPAPAPAPANLVRAEPPDVSPRPEIVMRQPEGFASQTTPLAQTRFETVLVNTVPARQDAAVAQQIVGAAVARPGRGVIEVHLDPPELGRVEISIDLANEGLKASLSIERHATSELLRRNAEMLHNSFRDAGFADVELDFNSFADGSAGEPAGGDEHLYDGANTVTAANERPGPTARIVANGLDLMI